MIMNFLQAELHSLKKEGLYRSLKTVSSAQGRYLVLDGNEYLCFCSNNYLDLANHPRLRDAAVTATRKYGCGAAASRLVSGTMEIHGELEKRIACFKTREDAIVYPTGYMANIGVITALVKDGDVVIIDRLNHASIIDGCLQSRARIRVYRHADMQSLEKILKACQRHRRRLIVTDSVFSMDGDRAHLPEIIERAKRYDAMVMIDEAHATGVLGKTGRGIEEFFNIEGASDIVMGTLSKAVGSIGGFVTGSAELIDYLRNRSRSFIYTTALSPGACAASIAGLKLIEENPDLIAALRENVRYVENGLSHLGFERNPSDIPIIPIVIGDTKLASSVSHFLFERHVLIPAIRPPTVLRGTARLRLTVMATHTRDDLDRLLDSMQQAKKKFRI